MLAAKAPVIHAGAGIKWGRGTAALLKLAEKLQLPITNSAGHTDVAPVDHPLYAGGGARAATPWRAGLTRESDLILALGTRLGFNTTFYLQRYAPTAHIIQVDIDPLAIGATSRSSSPSWRMREPAGALADIIEPMAAEHVPWQARNA